MQRSKGQLQNEPPILYRKGIDTTVPIYNGTYTLYANAMPRTVGNRNTVFKADCAQAWICHLQKELAIPMKNLHVYVARYSLCSHRLTGIDGIFQRV